MKRWTFVSAVSICIAATAALFAPLQTLGQSTPTASRAFDPSAFLGISGSYTGLNGTRNLGLTAGADLGFHPFFGVLPAVEVRGTYPLDNGAVVGERNVLGGLRVEKRYRGIRPYVDFLVGRGQLNYENGGYIVAAQDFRYLQSTTNVFSPGIGFETNVTERFAVRLDGQFQRWGVPFNASGSGTGSSSIYAKVGTIGVVYRFGWLVHGHPAP